MVGYRGEGYAGSPMSRPTSRCRLVVQVPGPFRTRAVDPARRRVALPAEVMSRLDFQALFVYPLDVLRVALLDGRVTLEASCLIVVEGDLEDAAASHLFSGSARYSRRKRRRMRGESTWSKGRTERRSGDMKYRSWGENSRKTSKEKYCIEYCIDRKYGDKKERLREERRH